MVTQSCAPHRLADLGTRDHQHDGTSEHREAPLSSRRQLGSARTPDPLHGLKGVSLIKSFSNAFSNTGNFAHSRTDVGEVKRP